jgi:hypothetical protein
MNCTTCQELLFAYNDKELGASEAADFESHLAICPACRAQQETSARLHRELTAHGETGGGVMLVTPVMERIHSSASRSTRSAIPFSALKRWLFGIGAATTAAAAITLAVFSPKTKAMAADVMTRGITAASQATSVHLQGRMRTLPRDNFAYIDTKTEFVPIELWKELGGLKRWRVEKPGRVAVMDGASTLLFIRPDLAQKVPRATSSAFDTDWLHRMADIEQTLSHGLKMAQTKGWKMELTRETDPSGAAHAVVTIETMSGLPANDYLTNKFIGTANLREVFRFEDTSGRLEALQFLVRGESDYTVIFETTKIDYDEPLAASVLTVDLPANVRWAEESLPPIANDEKYASMTAETAARTFFEACGRGDWGEAAAFLLSSPSDRLKANLGELKLLNLGESFTSAVYPGRFVPYEIQLRDGSVRKHNLALKHDKKSGRWFVDGGI